MTGYRWRAGLTFNQRTLYSWHGQAANSGVEACMEKTLPSSYVLLSLWTRPPRATFTDHLTVGRWCQGHVRRYRNQTALGWMLLGGTGHIGFGNWKTGFRWRAWVNQYRRAWRVGSWYGGLVVNGGRVEVIEMNGMSMKLESWGWSEMVLGAQVMVCLSVEIGWMFGHWSFVVLVVAGKYPKFCDFWQTSGTSI